MGHDRGGLELFDGPRKRTRSARRPRRRRNVGAAFLKGIAFAAGAIAVVGVWILITSLIRDDPVDLLVIDDRSGQPVVGAVVINERGGSAHTGDDGIAELAFDTPHRLSVSATGYHEATFQVGELPRQSTLTLMLNPLVLNGRVVDQRGVGLFGATVEIDGKTTTSGDFGSFEMTGVEPGRVVVSKVAWSAAEAEWDGSTGRLDIGLEPFVVRGLRVHSGAYLPSIFAMIEGTVINTLVFDTRIEDGQIVHAVDLPLAHEVDAVTNFYDVNEAIRESKARGLYTITRIVTFQDPFAAKAHPEWAIMSSATGEPWRNVKGLAWLDPTNEDAWEFSISLAEEVCRLGFDEIQFDYVRFPTDGDTSVAVYKAGAPTAEVRINAITGFLDAARTRIHEEGCAVSADIFGIVLSVGDDQGIGQKVEELSMVLDAMSPMVYPSHYGRGWLNLDVPNDHPGIVVGEALDAGTARMEGGSLMRPWLQAFAWSPAEVLESIAEAERIGHGWLLWNSLSLFEKSWLPLASE